MQKQFFFPYMTGKTLEIFLLVIWHGFPVKIIWVTGNIYADGTEYLKYVRTGILQYK